MKREKITEDFYLDEFIDPASYGARGIKSVELIDMRIVLAVQYLREQFNKPIVINNWASGKVGHIYKESGLRDFSTSTGAKRSQHKYGRAVDIKVAGMTPKEVHAFIHKHEVFLIERQWITTLEDAADTPSWTHIDCRYTGLNNFQIVNP